MLLNEPWKDKKRINAMVDKLDMQQSKVHIIKNYKNTLPEFWPK
jgi:hypothetical protein